MIGKNCDNSIITTGKSLNSLLSVIFLDQSALAMTFPMITLIFFDAQSRLFPSDTPHAVRSLWYGACVAIPHLLNLCFCPLLSSWSDEIGRKKILLIEVSCALFFCISIATGIVYGILSFIVLSFIIKGMFARTNPTALSMIGDTVSRKEKIVYMGYLQFAISAGAFIGPIVGGLFANRYFFHTVNFALPFLIAAVIAFINMLFTLVLIKETLHEKMSKKQRWQSFKTIVNHPAMLRTALILILIQMSWSMYYQYIPPVLKTLYGMPASGLGLFIGMIAFWLMVTTSLIIRALNRFLDVRQMLLISVYLILTGLALNILACHEILLMHHFWIWLAAFPIAAGDVIAYCCLTAQFSNLTSTDKQGKVMGLVIFIVALVWSCTGFLGGILLSISPTLPLLVAPAGAIAALLLIHAPFGKKLVVEHAIPAF